MSRPKLGRPLEFGALLRVRVTPELRAACQAAALADGVDLSEWMRRALERCARESIDRDAESGRR